MPTPDIIRVSMMEMDIDAKVTEGFDALYSGNYREYFADPRQRELFEEAANRWRLNFARPVVNTVVNRSEITGLLCPEDKGKTILDQFWVDNNMDYESKDCHKKSLVGGQSYIICLPDEETASGFSAYVHDARNVKVFYNPSKPRIKSHAVHRYDFFASDEDEGLVTGKRYLAVVIYYPDSIEQWVSVSPLPLDGVYDSEIIDLRLYQELPQPLAGVIPVFHYNVHESRLSDVYGPQSMVHETVISMMAAIRASGYRQRYLTSKRTPSTMDNFSNTPPPGTDDVQMKKYQQGPDTIWNFSSEGDVAVGSFDVSDSSNFYNLINQIRLWMGQITSTPSSYWRDSADSMSGDAYRQADRPFTDVVQDYQALWGSTWTELFDYILDLSGVDAEAEVVWEEQTPDDKDFWETQEIKAGLGVPKEAIYVEGGYPVEVAEKWAGLNALKEPAPAVPTVNLTALGEGEAI